MQDTKDIHATKNNNKDATGFDKVYAPYYHMEVKTAADLSVVKNENQEKCSETSKKSNISECSGLVPVIHHYLTLIILGLIVWGSLWCMFGDHWSWGGRWFRLMFVAIVAWASGLALNSLTTLPPLLAALLTGIIARNIDFLDMRDYIEVDMFFRMFYPIAILGKGSLGWDLPFMKKNWKQIAALGSLPWLAEVSVLAVSVHFFFGFPLSWGFMMGSIYASVSFAIIMPPTIRISAKVGSSRNWPKLICSAGGVDTALSVGVYGIFFSFIFYETSEIYCYAKMGLTLFAGVGLGVVMGYIAGLVPHRNDYYCTELRILLVMVGGLLANMMTSMYGWTGTGGVAVLVCNATAAHFWAHDGWKLNNNPASTAYRVLWSSLEPILFAYTGTYFVINRSLSQLLLPGFAILVICVLVRLTVVCLTCWNFSLKEKLFVCCTWTTKSIVEAVIGPLALNTLIKKGDEDSLERQYAEDLLRLIIQAILVTTPIGFLLTNYLGPLLLKQPEKELEKAENTSKKSNTPVSQNEDNV